LVSAYEAKDLAYGAPLRIGELKDADDGWEVAGYASTWARDLGNDVVQPGAFKSTLESGARVRFLYAHDASQVLGRPLALKEDATGLHGVFKISKTRLGHDVHTLLQDGSLDSFSIGFLAKDFDYDEKAGVRNLKQVDLLEISVVALPMNPQSMVTGVKGLDYGALNLEALLAVYEDHHRAALGQAKAVAERRLSEGRKLSDTTLGVLERLRSLSEDGAAELLRLSTTPPTPTPRDSAPPAPAEAVGPLVDAHLRRARLRELARVYGVSIP
jgi:HK97 family phage prohead protease